MKRVLLLHPPMDLGYTVLIPLGLAAIHAATPEGYQADAWDMTARRWADLSWQDLEPYDVIGVCVRYSYNERKVKQFLRGLADRSPNTTVVAGGQHATYDVEGLLSAGASYVVRFAGEDAWTELLTALRDGRDPTGIAGLAARREGRAWIGDDRPFADPDALPIPSFHLFRPRDYPFAMGYRAASVEASRGCPNACGFCTNPALWRGRWAAKSTPRIVEELDRVQRLGFTFVYFADDNFGVDPARLRELLDALARRAPVLPFMALMQPGTIARNPDVLDLAWRAGMRIVSLDTNTVDEPTRESYDRPDGLETVRRALDAVRSSRVAAVSNVIVGAPGEPKATMTRNVRFARRHADVFACGVLEPRPGNRYWREEHWRQTDRLCRGESLLHEDPAMVRRLVRLALLGYYFHPRQLLRALFSPKIGTRTLFRLHYRLYAAAVASLFLRRDRAAQPSRMN